MEEKTVIRVPLLRKIDCVKLKQKLKEKITPSDAMLTKIFELIKENKKIYVVSASKDRLKKWKDILLKLYPDINMIVYTGDNNSTRKRDDFSNIREKWSNADIVMTTTTITIGINFDVKNHFDVVCLHASKSAKNVIADLFQSHYRVRYPRDKVLYLSIDTFYNQPKLPITLNEIENHQGLVRDYFLEIKQKFVNPPPAIWDLVMDNILERNLGTQQIEMIIDKYLFECNYIERDSVPIDNIEDICDEYQLSLDPCIDIIEEKFEDIKLLNPFEARELLIKKNKEGVLTDEEIVQLDKAWFVSIFTENGIAWANRECVGELWEIWKNYGRIKIQNISREFKCREGVITLYDLISKQMDKSKYAGLQDTMIIQLEMVLKICEGLEINNSSEIGHVIPSAVVKKAHNKLSKQADNIRKTFNLRDRRKDKKSDDISYTDFMKLLSSVFSQFGVTSIKQLGRDYRKGVIQKYVIDTSPEFKKKHPKIKANVIYKEMLYAHLNIPKVNEMTNKQIKKGVIFESSLPP